MFLFTYNLTFVPQTILRWAECLMLDLPCPIQVRICLYRPKSQFSFVSYRWGLSYFKASPEANKADM